MRITIESKQKIDTWRMWVAHKLVALAKWIYPQSESVLSFYATLLHDSMITGKGVVRINPMDLYKKQEEK